MDKPTINADLPPDRLTTLWRRIKEHRIAQWTIGYVAVAYGIQHAVTLTSEALDWPHAVTRVSFLLLAMGLPVAMTLAWYHGERANRRISGPELSILSVLLVGVAILFYVFVRPSGETATPAAHQAGFASAVLSPAQQTGISVAVLPFANLSGDAGQEFFSDGMTEEITSALAKVSDLRVVARASAFQFKGEKKDIRAVGQALSARYLIDGSVRKAGARVRISAQLIEAGNGLQVWTESYDRDLKDIFATQEDIAQAIVTALKVPLGLRQGETLVRDRTSDLESYDQYLRAKALARSGGVRDLVQASKLLEQVVARDPGFAPGWALLAETYHAPPVAGSPEEIRRIVDLNMDKEEMAAREAIRLDPKYALGYAALARNQGLRGNRIAAEDLLKQALALDGDDPDVLSDYCSTLAITGRLKEATNLCMKLRTLDPLIPEYGLNAALIMQLNGQNRAAISVLEASPSSTTRNIRLARSYAAERRFAEAAETLLLINDPVAQETKEVEGAARLLRAAPAKISAPNALPDLNPGLSFVYAYVGALDRVLDAWESRRQINQTGLNSNMWLPVYAPLRKTERFKAYVRQGGLVDFWRARGWPDLCHPVGTDDFACN